MKVTICRCRDISKPSGAKPGLVYIASSAEVLFTVLPPYRVCTRVFLGMVEKRRSNWALFALVVVCLHGLFDTCQPDDLLFVVWLLALQVRTMRVDLHAEEARINRLEAQQA